VAPEAVIPTALRQVQSLDTNLALTNVNSIGELIDREGNYDRFRGRIHNKGIPAERPTESIHSFPGFSNFKLRVFNNGQEFPGTSGDDINHDSLVFQLSQPPTTTHLHSSL
jgi:hypothetical protein